MAEPWYPEDHWTHDKAICQCTRCTGFQPGHQLSKGLTHERTPAQHGALSSPLRLAPDAEKIAVMVRPLMPVKSPAFEGVLQTYCILLARLQKAHTALEKEAAKVEESEREHDKLLKTDPEAARDFVVYSPKYQYLAEEMRKWMSASLKHATQLGLTPASAAAILRDTTGGHQDLFRPPSEQDLSQLSTAKLRELRDAMTNALLPEDFIEGEVV